MESLQSNYLSWKKWDPFSYIILQKIKLEEGDVFLSIRLKSKRILKKIIKDKYNKIVISPGPGHPKSSGICINLVKNFYKTIPILGICLGHQIIGAAFGSVIKRAKIIMHGKLSKIIHNGSLLFKKIPKNFYATRYHSLIIDKKTLNENFEISAIT